MTKMKSRKMTKSTFAIIIMAIAMVAMLAFGGTYAYFTATATTASTSFTTGIVQLTSGATVTVIKDKVVDNQEVLGSVEFSIGSTDVDTWVFITLDVDVTGQTGVTVADIFGSDLAVNTAWSPLTDNDGVYYQKFTVGSEFTGEFVDTLVVSANPNWIEDDDQPVAMGATVEITIAGEAIQAYGLETAAAAYAALNA